MFNKKPQDLDQQMVQSTLDYFGVIERYTARQLTYPASDKLPAFGAIGGYHAQVFNSRYLAGCFEQHFPACLAWRVKEGYPIPKTDAGDHQRPS